MLIQGVPNSEDLARAVELARARTLALVDDLADSQLSVPLAENVNPFLWELGHVAFFYDLFLLRELDGVSLLMEAGEELYNSFEVAHEDRWGLELPGRGETLRYMEEVRRRVVERIEGRTPTDYERYVYLLAVQHEDMHGEAFTYMRQFLELSPPSAVVQGTTSEREDAGPLPGDAEISGGTFMLGARKGVAFAYDNEKWAHAVDIEPFAIARAPVTNEEFAVFVEEGGYTREKLWSYPGNIWRARKRAQCPVTWRRDISGWLRRDYDRLVPLEPHHPVSHVSWFEAEAFCNWAGRRLPSEAEWELAASGALSEEDDIERRYAWGERAPEPGLANLASWYGGTVDVAALQGGESSFGCRQMTGNVWEWTDSDFYPFPGYVLDQPYKEYSAPWFGDRKVLRGGCWATQPSLAYNTYRNFFQPQRTDILSGFRTCARP